MNEYLIHIVKQATGASDARRGEVIQSLWSGYGEIVRMYLEGAPMQSVVLKHVRFPTEADHPRGWHSDRSHARKVKSYDVEMAWYHDYANRCSEAARVPHCYYAGTLTDDEHVMILEDLDAAGFPLRLQQVDRPVVEHCLTWLANFHAEFLGESPDKLWPTGTYWHLATRPDELEAMQDRRLRNAAAAIDAKLESCRHKTLVHGDAKIANFCFSNDGQSVAAVDFQYVGGGCGMKDVTYLLGSCLDEVLIEAWEQELLDHYFNSLSQAIDNKGINIDFPVLKNEWHSLYYVATADFYRFLTGWMPGHWKVNGYNQRITTSVMEQMGL